VPGYLPVMLHGDFHTTGVDVKACEEAVSIQADPANGVYGPGSTVDSVTLVAGNTTRIRDTS
jgi:hypothetical protein